MQIDLKQFQAEFNATLKFLKQTLKGSQRLIQLPWYLVVGANSAGKSMLIAQSELEFVLAKKKYQSQQAISTRYCDWWVTQSGIFLDINGDFFQPEHRQLLDVTVLWHQLLTNLKQLARYQPCSGIIYALSIPDLVTNNDKYLAQLGDVFQVRWRELQQTFKVLPPLYVCITKIDQLPGFNDFFNDSSQEIRQQACGFNLPYPLIAKSAIATITKHYQQWFLQLQQQLWQHQQHATTLHQRAGNFNWLIQLQLLRPRLLAWLQQAFNPTIHDDISLSGIYFTCALAHPYSYDPLKKHLPNHIQRTHELIQPTPIQQRPFFIHGLFHRVIFPRGNQLQQHYHQQRQQNKRRLHYLFLGASVLFGMGELGSLLLTHHSTVQILDQALAQLEWQQQNDAIDYSLANRLNTLATLYQASQINTEHRSLRLLDYTNKLTTVREEINHFYRATLNHTVLPQLAHTFAQHLADPSITVVERYALLKAYLMLGQRLPLDFQWFFAFITDYWQAQLSPAQQEQFVAQLHYLFTHTWFPIMLDDQLIQTNREYFNQLSVVERGYVIARNHLWHPTLHVYSELAERAPWLTSQQQTTHIWLLIPKLLTSEQLTSVAHQAHLGNEVIGHMKENLETEVEQLGQLILERYINEYCQQWSQAIQALHWKPIAQLTEFHELIAQFSQTQYSSIWQVLSALREWLLPIDLPPALHNQLIEALGKHNIWLPEPEDKYLLQAQFSQLTHFLQDQLDTEQPEQQAFLFAQQRFTNRLKQDPLKEFAQFPSNLASPIHHWLNSIADNAWQLILQEAAMYLNHLWIEFVWSAYDSTINRRYPIVKTSQQPIELIDFANFFGPEGILDHFFNAYLKEFIDVQQAQWQLKTIFNRQLPITLTTLRQLERAAIIQRMFFPQQTQFPSLHFYLQPLHIDKSLKTVQLTIDGQTLKYPNNIGEPLDFHWPGPETEQGVTLIFKDDQHTNTVYQEQGTWALFRFLEHAELTKLPNDDGFTLSLNFQGKKLHYRLVVKEPINPFIDGILEHFSLNRTITKTL